MQTKADAKGISEKVLDVRVYCTGYPVFSDIDPQIKHNGRWLETKPMQAPCKIPVKNSGKILKNLVNHTDIAWVKFSHISLGKQPISEGLLMYGVGSDTFQKLIALQSGESLGNFDINTCDDYGNTLLHWATACLDVSMVKELLNKGAEDTIQNNMEQTPAYYAEHCSEDQEVQDVFNQWAEMKVNTETDKVNTFLAFQQLHQDTSNPLPFMPPEVVEQIVKNQTPSFDI